MKKTEYLVMWSDIDGIHDGSTELWIFYAEAEAREAYEAQKKCFPPISFDKEWGGANLDLIRQVIDCDTGRCIGNTRLDGCCVLGTERRKMRRK